MFIQMIFSSNGSLSPTETVGHESPSQTINMYFKPYDKIMPADTYHMIGYLKENCLKEDHDCIETVQSFVQKRDFMDPLYFPDVLWSLGNLSFGCDPIKIVLDQASEEFVITLIHGLNVYMHPDSIRQQHCEQHAKILFGLGRLSHIANIHKFLKKAPLCCYQSVLLDDILKKPSINLSNVKALVFSGFGDLAINGLFFVDLDPLCWLLHFNGLQINNAEDLLAIFFGFYNIFESEHKKQWYTYWLMSIRQFLNKIDCHINEISIIDTACITYVLSKIDKTLRSCLESH